jgi:uncharacterized protein (DUF1501 family)
MMSHNILGMHSRRDFLRRSGQLALGSTALPFALNLAAIGDAAAFNSSSGDYKALVCVFLQGGNDYANTVVTYDNASYDKYHTIRTGVLGQSIALAKADLAATLLSPATAPVDSLGVSRQFALHPSMTAVASLFNTGKAAVLLNVGPLMQPMTRAQYDSLVHLRPPRLFSHNDQQSIWQSLAPEGSKVGWGGRMGDVALQASMNSLATLTCMSVTGNAVFLSGDQALQYQMTPDGAMPISAITEGKVYGSTEVSNLLAKMVSPSQPRSHVLENEYTKVTIRSKDLQTTIANALKVEPSAAFAAALNAFPTDGLSKQLKMVARLINGNTILGARRQVFMVALGGFDLHDNLISKHPVLLAKVSQALNAFYNATDAMGMADKVTTFTASDFGRTLTSNGDGSDHGWGGHHFIVGGAVKGKAFYGKAPPVSVSDNKTLGAYDPEAQWHVGQGRLLPSTSVDQYAATLAKWFGVTDAEMPSVLPNIGNFTVGNGYPPDLGFML